MDPKLFVAAASGDMDILRRVTPQKNSYLHIAVNSKQKEYAKQVLFLCPSLVLEANKKGDTPLHVAARIGSLELARLLINTAKTLHADVEGQEVDVMKDLLRTVNEKKETALHVAARNGHLGVVKLLMEADLGLLDLVNNANQSPLSLAVLLGFSDIALHILETSPSSPCGGTNGMNALHRVVFAINKGPMKRLVEIRPEMIKEADIFERTPLHYAALLGDLEAVRLFFQCDSSAAYLPDKNEMSPLHLAANGGHIDVARELIQCCPYIWESLDKKGQTALHVAVIAGRIKMVKYILEVPELVDLINEPDNEGNTPLHLAAVYERNTIISILARDKRVNKYALNNEFFTARDIFDSKEQKNLAVAKVEYLLKGTNGAAELQRGFDRELMGLQTCNDGMKGKALEEGKSDSVTVNEGFDESKRSMFEVHLLVAVLIATVTFAAAFTMPGGYKSEGPDQGMPNFIDRAAFKAFVIFDTTAFCFSAATVALLFYASLDGYHRRPNFVGRALLSTFMAMLSMVLAFATGTYIMLAKSLGLALTAYVMNGCFLLVFFVYWFCDPRCNSILNRPRIYFRNLLFEYGIF